MSEKLRCLLFGFNMHSESERHLAPLDGYCQISMLVYRESNDMQIVSVTIVHLRAAHAVKQGLACMMFCMG